MKSENNDDTLEAKMVRLSELKSEYKANRKAFREANKDLTDRIQILENLIRHEVMEKRETVTVGNIRAEYVPQVVIRMKKDKDNEQ